MDLPALEEGPLLVGEEEEGRGSWEFQKFVDDAQLLILTCLNLLFSIRRLPHPYSIPAALPLHRLLTCS